MDITLRGWNRDMGKTLVADHDLAEMRVSRDPNKTIGWDRPGLFKSFGEVSVAWKQKLHKTGNFRMQVNFTRSDAAKIFKAMFGSELDAEVLEQYGFTLSDDVKKKVLGEIKLADLTIGELAGLSVPSKPAQTETEPTPATVRPFRRI
jgi:hypothetical protein